MKIYEKFGEFKKDGKKIAFTHFPEIAKDLPLPKNITWYFMATPTNHGKKPSEKQNKISQSGKFSRNLFYKATFAIYYTKTDKLELKILEKL